MSEQLSIFSVYTKSWWDLYIIVVVVLPAKIHEFTVELHQKDVPSVQGQKTNSFPDFKHTIPWEDDETY